MTTKAQSRELLRTLASVLPSVKRFALCDVVLPRWVCFSDESDAGEKKGNTGECVCVCVREVAKEQQCGTVEAAAAPQPTRRANSSVRIRGTFSQVSEPPCQQPLTRVKMLGLINTHSTGV